MEIFRLQTLYFSLLSILLLAAVLDYLIGDPWGWPHPVRVMGWVINKFTQFVLKQWQNKLVRQGAGVILGVSLIVGSGLTGWLIVRVANLLHPLFGIAVESILLASCFALRSLRAAAKDVMQPLSIGDIATARSKLSLYVGRDTENLSETEILRAVLETVTENATDGVMAPLFYALVGMVITVIWHWHNLWMADTEALSLNPFPLIVLPLAYKAASTLDSMVGYREEPYSNLGWFSARLEDVLTWLPCRLTVITLALISGKPRHVLHLCRRDAVKDKSPNSGWSECAYAAILGVQVGGINYYRGVTKHKPLLGDNLHPITPTHIYQALQLTRYCFLSWVGIAIAAFGIIS